MAPRMEEWWSDEEEEEDDDEERDEIEVHRTVSLLLAEHKDFPALGLRLGLEKLELKAAAEGGRERVLLFGPSAARETAAAILRELHTWARDGVPPERLAARMEEQLESKDSPVLEEFRTRRR